MAVLWISGRTSLLLTLFAVLSATAFIRGRHWTAAGWTLLAVLSKEEAVLLPAVFLAWWVVTDDARSQDRPERPPSRLRRACQQNGPVWLAVAAYGVLRWHSGAFGPATAPMYYRFVTDVGSIAINVAHYLDRAATLAVAGMLLASVVAWRLPRFSRQESVVLKMAGVWFAAAYALTVLLPVRSSLYACFPSVGASLVAGVWISHVCQGLPKTRWRTIAVALLVVAVGTVPIYWIRNARWTVPAAVSSRVLAQLKQVAASLPTGGAVVLYDQTDSRDQSLAAAFGTLLPDAVALTTGRRGIRLWVEPPPNDWQLAGWQRLAHGKDVRELRLKGGALVEAASGR